MAIQDPLFESAAEATTVPVGQPSPPSSWTVLQTGTPLAQGVPIAPNPAIDATSRVVSFVLGFALASVFAWLWSIPTGEAASTVVAAPQTESVAPAVGSMVTAATVVTPSTPAATASATSPAVPRAATAAPQPPAPSAPPSSARRRRAVSGYRGALVLNSNPEGAEVLLNGKVVGQTPVVLNDLPVGSRALLVRRVGYAPWSASVRIVANQRTPVRTTLKPLGQSPGS